MIVKPKDNWIPRWQRTWNKLPLAKGQRSYHTNDIREHPVPRFNPLFTNHQRMLQRQANREALQEALRKARTHAK